MHTCLNRIVSIVTKALNITGVFDTIFHHYIEEIGEVVFKRA